MDNLIKDIATLELFCWLEPGAELHGKIALLSYPDEVVGAAQLYLGVPFCSENPDEMKKVLDLLMAQSPPSPPKPPTKSKTPSAVARLRRISGGMATR